MSTQELENINSELFDFFDPEQELWILGGSTRWNTISSTMNSTYGNGLPDWASDVDVDWA
jgi:hypothetical protein